MREKERITGIGSFSVREKEGGRQGHFFDSCTKKTLRPLNFSNNNDKDNTYSHLYLFPWAHV